MDLIHAVLLFLIFRNVDFLYREIRAGEYGFFETAALGAIALMFYNIEDFIAFIAFRHAGDDVYDELCALKNAALNGYVVNILNVLGDDERKLADVENDFFNFCYIIFLRKVFDCAYDLSYNAYFVHDYFFAIFLTAIRPTA